MKTLMIRGLRWDISTSNDPGAGTDARLACEIFRDGNYLFRVNLEPGETERLDRGTFFSLYYMFTQPFYALPIDQGIAQGVVGIEFPQGIAGHLSLKLQIYGDDKWVKDRIEVYARLGELIRDEEGGGLLVYDDKNDWEFIGFFGQKTSLSTNPDEGFTSWRLNF